MTIRDILQPYDGEGTARTDAITTGLIMAAALMTTAIMATPAASQEEQLPPGLVIEVTPQGWLNTPNVSMQGELPGSMRRQVILDTYISRDSAFAARPDSFGESVLPRGRGPGVNLRTID
jgi:hypothetical protein